MIDKLKDRLKQLRKAGEKAEKIAKLDSQIAAAVAACREAENRASAILDTVYDLKAVNPNAVANADVRTVGDLLHTIATEGRTIESALRRLAGAATGTRKRPRA